MGSSKAKEVAGKNIENILRVSNSITESFSKLKFVTIACVVCTFLTAVVCVYYTMNEVHALGRSVYVLNNGQVLTATRQDASVTRIDEVKAQSENFHKLFFNVSPNRDMVTRNVEMALEISDRSAYDYFNDLQERGFYKRFAQASAVQEVVIDSVRVNMNSYPSQVVTYASLFVTRESNITMSSLVTRCNMIDVPRNPKNLNGLQIEKFEVIENREVQKRKRN